MEFYERRCSQFSPTHLLDRCGVNFVGIHMTNITTKIKKSNPLGLCPKPQSHLRRRRGRWGKPTTYPSAKCWVDSKASRVKCTTSSPLTPLHLRGGSKTNRSGRSWKPVKACEATAQRLGLYRLEATQSSVVGVQGLSRRRRMHPCHAASVGFGATPQGVNKPLGGRVVGVDSENGI